MVDYKEVLSDLRNKKAMLRRRYDEEIAELESAITAIEKMVPPVVTAVVEPPATVDQPYTDMTIKEAAHRCLETERKPMKTKELAGALLKGGLKTTAGNFNTTVYGTLTRYDEFTVDAGFWSLTEWEG